MCQVCAQTLRGTTAIGFPYLLFGLMKCRCPLCSRQRGSSPRSSMQSQDYQCACVDDAGWKPSSSGSKEFRGENSRHTHQNQHVTRLTHFMAFRKTTVVSGDNKKRIQIQSRQRTPPPTGLCFEASSLTLWLMPSCLFVLSPDVPVPPKSTLIPFLCKNTVKDKLCGCQSKSLWASFLRGRAVVIEYKYIYSSTVQF